MALDIARKESGNLYFDATDKHRDTSKHQKVQFLMFPLATVLRFTAMIMSRESWQIIGFGKFSPP